MVFAPRSGSRWCCFSLANNYHVPLRYRLRGVFSPSLLSDAARDEISSVVFSRIYKTRRKRENNPKNKLQKFKLLLNRGCLRTSKTRNFARKRKNDNNKNDAMADDAREQKQRATNTAPRRCDARKKKWPAELDILQSAFPHHVQSTVLRALANAEGCLEKAGEVLLRAPKDLDDACIATKTKRRERGENAAHVRRRTVCHKTVEDMRGNRNERRSFGVKC